MCCLTCVVEELVHRLPVVDVVQRLRQDVGEAQGGEGCLQRLGQRHSEPWQAKVHSFVLGVTGGGGGLREATMLWTDAPTAGSGD